MQSNLIGDIVDADTRRFQEKRAIILDPHKRLIADRLAELERSPRFTQAVEEYKRRHNIGHREMLNTIHYKGQVGTITIPQYVEQTGTVMKELQAYCSDDWEAF